MYGARAELYDPIYHWKDYAAEADAVVARLDDLGVPRGGQLLEAGCGTGSHLVHLRGRYAVSGFDLHEGMLDVARRKLPDLPLFRADIRDFVVREPVDAITSLFSTIGYLRDEAELAAAARAFAAALRPGGALVIEPWLTREGLDVGRPGLQTATGDPDLLLARAMVSRVEGEHSVLDMHWLVARRGADVEHFVERHVLWLCPRETFLRVLGDAGFDARFEPDGLMKGRGLYLAVRR